MVQKTQYLLASTDCLPLCFDPLHICDRACEARMHKFSLTISVFQPIMNPKLFNTAIRENK